MSENDKRKKVDDGDKDRSPQVGALLRATRTRLGEDLREIADVLCIRYLYLEAIEDCRYSDLPGDTYVIGFIRSYAEHMGLDGEEVVRRFRAEQLGNRRSNELSFPTPVPESGVPKGAIVFIGVVLAMLVYGGWYMSTTDEGILSDLISPVPDHLKHLVTGDDAVTTASPDADTLEESGAEASASTATNAESETAPTATVPQPELPPEPTPSESAASAAEQVEAQTADVAATETATAVTEQAETTMSAAEPVAQAATEAVESSTATAAAEAVREAETVATPEAAAETVTQAVAETVAEANTETPAVTEAVQTASTPEPAETPAAAETTDTPVTPAPVEVAEAPPPPAAQELTADQLNALSLKRVTTTDEAPATESQETETTATEVASTPPPVPVSAPASTRANADVAASGIVIRATNSSWVEIRDPADRVVFTGLMSAGASYSVPDTPGLLLATGNAGALDITVDGTSVPKLGDIGTVRKGVALDADRLKAGTATAR